MDVIRTPIKTQRLTVRLVKADDWQALQRIWIAINDTEFAQYDSPHPTDDETLIKKITAWVNACKGTDHLFWIKFHSVHHLMKLRNHLKTRLMNK